MLHIVHLTSYLSYLVVSPPSQVLADGRMRIGLTLALLLARVAGVGAQRLEAYAERVRAVRTRQHVLSAGLPPSSLGRAHSPSSLCLPTWRASWSDLGASPRISGGDIELGRANLIHDT